MTRLAVATIVLITLLCTLSFAQDSTPKVQVFGGYSFLHADTGGLTDATLYNGLREPNNPFSIANNFNGWNAQAQYNTNRWFGIAADFGGRYGSPIVPGQRVILSGMPKGTGYSGLFGPVISFRGKSKVTPFIHALFGYDRINVSSSTITGRTGTVTTFDTTYTDAAVALGGGLDYRLTGHIGLRLVQLDEFYTTHNLNKYYDSVFHSTLFNNLRTNQRNVRISTGITVRF